MNVKKLQLLFHRTIFFKIHSFCFYYININSEKDLENKIKKFYFQLSKFKKISVYNYLIDFPVKIKNYL